MAATHYMIFGRIITYVGEGYSPVRAQRVTAIFVVFDVIVSRPSCSQGSSRQFKLTESQRKSVFRRAGRRRFALLELEPGALFDRQGDLDRWIFGPDHQLWNLWHLCRDLYVFPFDFPI